MKVFFQNLTLIVFGIIVALVLAEIGLRLAGYGSGNPYERLLNHNDEYVGYRMIPGDHETIDGPDGIYDVRIVSAGLDDERGFRDDVRQDPAYSLFFGDSFVWGYGVEIEDSVSEQFETLTGKNAINFGMTAFTSPTQYYRLFRQYAPKLHAKYAFFGFFMGNDFGDSLNFDRWLLGGKLVSYPEWRTRQIREIVGNSWSNRIRRVAYRNSVLWRFLADRIQLSHERKLKSHRFEIKTDMLDLVLDGQQIAASMGSSGERQVELVRRALKQIMRVGKSFGTRPVVFLIPTKELVYQDYFPEESYRTAEDIHYRTMVELLDESGIDYIDLLPAFRKSVAEDEKQFYFRIDGHWNAAGHALAASELFKYIQGRSGS